MMLFLNHPEYFSLKERIYFLPLKWVSRYAHAIITISENEKQRLLKFNYSQENKINVAYLGISNLFRPREAYPQEAKDNVKEKYKLPEDFLLYVGVKLNVKRISKL